MANKSFIRRIRLGETFQFDYIELYCLFGLGEGIKWHSIKTESIALLYFAMATKSSKKFL